MAAKRAFGGFDPSGLAIGKALAALAALAIIGVVTIIGWSNSRARITGGTEQERADCIYRLADSQPPGAGAAIASAADDPSPAIRQAVMIALGRFAPKCRAAVEKGTRDADPTVRAAAAGSLGKHEDEQAAIRLGEMLSDADESVRGEAIVGLQRTNRPLSIALLAGVLDDTKQPAHIRTKALKVLADLHGYRFSEQPDPIATPERWAVAVSRAKALPTVDKALKLYPRNGAKP